MEPLELKRLEAATLQLLASVRDLPDLADDLVDITEDGVIDEGEKAEMESILRSLRKAAQKIHTLELIYQKRLQSPEGDDDG